MNIEIARQPQLLNTPYWIHMGIDHDSQKKVIYNYSERIFFLYTTTVQSIDQMEVQGSILKAWRERENLSQREAVERLTEHIEITLLTWRNHEQKHRHIGRDRLALLMKLLFPERFLQSANLVEIDRYGNVYTRKDQQSQVEAFLLAIDLKAQFEPFKNKLKIEFIY